MGVWLRRLDQVERDQREIERGQREVDRWRARVDVVLDGVAHLEVRMESALDRQTVELKTEFSTSKATLAAEFAALKTTIESVVKKQSTWDNFVTFLRYAALIGVVLIGALWAFGTFVYQQMHGTGAK